MQQKFGWYGQSKRHAITRYNAFTTIPSNMAQKYRNFMDVSNELNRYLRTRRKLLDKYDIEYMRGNKQKANEYYEIWRKMIVKTNEFHNKIVLKKYHDIVKDILGNDLYVLFIQWAMFFDFLKFTAMTNDYVYSYSKTDAISKSMIKTAIMHDTIELYLIKKLWPEYIIHVSPNVIDEIDSGKKKITYNYSRTYKLMEFHDVSEIANDFTAIYKNELNFYAPKIFTPPDSQIYLSIFYNIFKITYPDLTRKDILKKLIDIFWKNNARIAKSDPPDNDIKLYSDDKLSIILDTNNLVKFKFHNKDVLNKVIKRLKIKRVVRK